ncbi:SDR family NAD(P)-dependent oxidoreductase [Pacificimonas sp. ICDLI1SI03]
MTDLDRRTLMTSAAAAGFATTAASQTQAQGVPSAGKPLSGRVALVTGSGRGIGRASAVALARAGADVAVLDIADPDAFPFMPYPLATRDDVAETVSLVEAEGVRALSIIADVRDLPAMQDAVTRTRERFDRIDIVHANAGINIADDTIESFEPDIFDAIHAVNVRGVANTIKAAADALPRPGGRIIVTTSLAGRSGSSSFAYASSKWGASGVMKAAALNLGPEGITVNAVATGPVETMMAYRDVGGRWTDETQAAADRAAREGNVLPVDQTQPEAIGRAVVFLAAPESDHISGMTIDVNAGRSSKFLS